MRNNLLAATAISGLAFFAATPAFATCTTYTPANGATVTCDATGTQPDTTYVNGSANTGVTVNVTGGTLNAGAPAAVALGNNGTVNVTGNSTINGNGTVGVAFSGTDTLSIEHGSTVTGGTVGLYANGGAGDTLTINNNGLLSSIFMGAGNEKIIYKQGTGGTIGGSVAAGSNVADEFHLTGTSLADTGTITGGSFTNGGGVYGNYEIFKVDGGTWTLNGVSGTAKDWTVASGAALIGTVANIGTGSITNGSLAITGANTTFTGGVSGTGALGIANNSIVTFSGTNTQSGGGFITNASTGIINSASALGTGTWTVDFSTFKFGGAYTASNNFTIGANDATFDTNGNNDSISGNIGGTGDARLVKSGTGTLILSGTNTYDGRTILGGGTLSVGTSNALGNGSSTNLLEFNGGTLAMTSAFNQTRDVLMTGNGTIDVGNGASSISGNLSGTGTLTKTGAGDLYIVGDHTNTGDIAIAAGTFGLLDNTDRTYAGVISGAGDFQKAGTGNLNLTGTSTLTGEASVSQGTLSVNGTMNNISDMDVISGGTLGGTGSVNNVTVESGGTLAPGNSIGTLHVTGLANIQNGAHYAVQYDNTSADKTIATGAITIGNTAILDLTGTGAAGAYSTSTIYSILQGASVTGTFGTINNNLAFLDATQHNTGTTLDITLNRNDISFTDVAKDDEQAQVAQAVTNLGGGNVIFDQFTGLTTAEAQDALDDLSGEHNAGVGTAIAQSAGVIQNVLTTHMAGLSHEGDVGDTAALTLQDPSVYNSAYLEPEAGLSSSRMWMQAIGTFGQSDANGGTPKQDRHSYGAIGGLDVPLEHGLIGAFAGYERGEVTTDSENASSDLNNYHLGAYAMSSVWDHLTLSGGVGATYHDIQTSRHVAVGALEFSPHGDTDAYTTDAFAQVSTPLAFNGVAVEPFAGVNVTYTHMNGYDESDGGAANLSVDGSNTVNPATILGARFGKSFGEDYTFNLSASLGWQHTFGDIDGEITERFVGGTTDFSAFGADRDRDAAVVALGLGAYIGPGTKVFAGYDGTLSLNNQDHGFKAGVKIDF